MASSINKISLVFLFFLLIYSCETNKEETEIITQSCPLGKFNGVSISYQNTREEVDSLGASNIHIWMHWDITEPEIFQPSLTINDVTEEMIQAYSNNLYH